MGGQAQIGFLTLLEHMRYCEVGFKHFMTYEHCVIYLLICYGMVAIQVLSNAVRGGIRFPGKKCYKGIRFNFISVSRGWVGVKFPRKRHFVTLP